jgi:hypothetical protein
MTLRGAQPYSVRMALIATLLAIRDSNFQLASSECLS